MPNIITHTIFCEEVFKNIEHEKYREIIQKNRKEYLIGTNGPDFLFFHGAFPIYKKQDMTIPNIGTSFHRRKINAFYKSAIKTYRAQKAGYLKDAMASYIIGHYLHWQLDSKMHPFVVYFTGFGEPLSKVHHHRFESMMDTINLKQYRNESIKTYETFKICRRSKYSVKAVSNIYVPAVKTCFDIDIDEGTIKQSLEDWEKAQKYLYDPKKIKFRFLKIYEGIIRQPWMLSGNIVLADVDTRYDVMNVAKQEWRQPCTGEVFSESADEIFEQAMDEALIGLPLLFDALDKKPMKPLLDFIDNKTYANGVKGKVERQFKDDIYERKKRM